jgi:hypothetical protein
MSLLDSVFRRRRERDLEEEIQSKVVRTPRLGPRLRRLMRV